MSDSSFIFSSLPPSIDTLCSTEELDLVRSLLFERRGEWLSGAVIAELVDWPKERTAEKVRRAVKELQMLGVPIVSGHAGFSWATNQRMIDLCVEHETTRVTGLLRSIQALKNIRVDEHQEVVNKWLG